MIKAVDNDLTCTSIECKNTNVYEITDCCNFILQEVVFNFVLDMSIIWLTKTN